MVVVDVAVAARPDEVARLEVALLREHVREERVARDVERDAEEDVGAALVDLAAESLAAGDVELEERVAGRERHPWDLGDVPGAHDDPPRVGVLAEEPHDLCDLVDMAAVGRRPAAPLHAVDGPELAVRVRPLVPDRDAVLLQPADVRVAAQEPEELDATDLKCTFFVVTSGKPSARSKRIWYPNVLTVPVPVRSLLGAPS